MKIRARRVLKGKVKITRWMFSKGDEPKKGDEPQLRFLPNKLFLKICNESG